MKTIDVLVVRVYITESSQLLNKIINYLKNDAKIRGLSVFRAIKGFGESGDYLSSFSDLSLDFSLTIEFYDKKENVEKALDHLNGLVKAEHIVFWEAKANIK